MNTQTQVLAAMIIFLFGYLVNIFYITVLYHRGLTHNAVILSPMAKFLVQHTGNWVTGIDPKSWACMHRFHHIHSDTIKDPHSPVHQGVFGVWLGQHKSYEKILRNLIRKEAATIAIVEDIDFDVSYLNRKKLWFVPHIIHFFIGILLSFVTSSYLIGIAYFLGIASHPIQGWLVNSFAHKFGYRNFPSKDNSQNNTFVSLLVFGEGLQNNHHYFPERAKFSIKWFEIDLGYLLCLLASKFKIIHLRSS